MSGDLCRLVGLSEEMTHRRSEAEAARRKAIEAIYTRDEALASVVPTMRFPAPPGLTGKRAAPRTEGGADVIRVSTPGVPARSG